MDRILEGMWLAIKEQMVEDFSIFGLLALVILVLCILLVLLIRRRTTPQIGLSKIRNADTLLPTDREPKWQSASSDADDVSDNKDRPSDLPPVVRPPEPVDLSDVRLLGTLPFETSELFHRESTTCYGMTVHAVFFDPDDLGETHDTARRLVPFFPENAAEVLVRESDRRNFRAGPLVAQPDAVLMLPRGLVSVEYKSKGGRFDDTTRWRSTLRPADLYQTILAAAAVSIEEARPVAPILRTVNAVYFLLPSPELLAALGRLLPQASLFLGDDTIGAKDAADLVAVPLRKAFPNTTNREGEAAHRRMLR